MKKGSVVKIISGKYTITGFGSIGFVTDMCNKEEVNVKFFILKNNLEQHPIEIDDYNIDFPIEITSLKILVNAK